jgi:Oxidoreductase family, NAD-binding Rossmann fold
MNKDRRDFLRHMALGTGALATGLPVFANQFAATDEQLDRSFRFENNGQRFNMCGYAAPKIETVRVGIIGLGNRGSEAVGRLAYIDGLEIIAIADKYATRCTEAQKTISAMGRPKAVEYSGSEEAWKGLCERNDIDLVYICTPWKWHTPMALYAMNHEKHAATEVPAAETLDQCWELVEISEKTKKHCMMLENCCYDFFEQLTLNLVRQGMLGEVVHVEGAYIHDLRELNFSKTYYADMWRLKENASRNGNLYPTHGLGPIAQCLNINRGDRMEHLVSMSSNDFMMEKRAEEEAAKDPFFNEFVHQPYRGDMNTTLIHTQNGKTMMVQHDVTTPRPYSRIHLVSGTKGVASKWPDPEKIAFGHEWIKKEELQSLYEKYATPIVKHIGTIAKDVGGHGGMDFIMDWRLIDCLHNGLALDQNVYDAALWSSVSPLSERSVAKRSRTVDIPDFTRGAWSVNKPVDMTLNGGATTGVRSIKPSLKM